MQTDSIVPIPSLPIVKSVAREGQRQPGKRSFADDLRQRDARAGAGDPAPAAAPEDATTPPLESRGPAIRKSGDGALHVDVVV